MRALLNPWSRARVPTAGSAFWRAAVRGITGGTRGSIETECAAHFSHNRPQFVRSSTGHPSFAYINRGQFDGVVRWRRTGWRLPGELAFTCPTGPASCPQSCVHPIASAPSHLLALDRGAHSSSQQRRFDSTCGPRIPAPRVRGGCPGLRGRLSPRANGRRPPRLRRDGVEFLRRRCGSTRFVTAWSARCRTR